MLGMVRFRGFRNSVASAMLLLLVASAGCSRQSGLRTAEGAQNQGQAVPFHQDDRSASAPSTGGGQTDSVVPFNHSPLVTLPVGTLLTVRLDTAVSGDKPDEGREFAAAVDAPVTIDGSIVLPRGTEVTGRVECAHTSASAAGVGFVCLTLNSVLLGGKSTPVQTSSLFARGSAGEGAAHGAQGGPRSAVQLGKGHRLTFRISQDVALARPAVQDAASNLSQGSR